ncbi:MAG: gamma-glutamylcyclotransferase [Cyanobacteria bacterium REEB459]|nr:gamma-glutamylcyclotransferase [Cyanobacteria bacterium REEB459]
MSEATRLFVYGTLKPGEWGFEQWCAGRVTALAPAIALGRLYHLALGYPALCLEPGWVQGVVLSLPTTLLATLDSFEGYDPHQAQQSEYQRQWQPIYHCDLTPFTWAWLYTMTQDRIQALGGEWLPQGIWSQSQGRG